MLTIAPETPYQPEVAELLRQSEAFSQGLYPPESNHMIDAGMLAAANARFLVVRRAGSAVGCGALVLGEGGQAELKRMFVTAAARGSGAGRAVLEALEEIARREGVRFLQLETGIENHGALALYRRAGFRERGPFGAYGPDPLSVFMEKPL